MDSNEESKKTEQTEEATPHVASSDSKLTRAEFLKKVAMTGALTAAPIILDSFLVQPAAARSHQRVTNPWAPPGSQLAWT